MSREFFATVTVRDFDPLAGYEIVDCVGEWLSKSEAQTSDTKGQYLIVRGFISIGGGRSEASVKQQIADGVWVANLGPCEIQIGFVYIEDPENTTFSPSDYAKSDAVEIVAQKKADLV